MNIVLAFLNKQIYFSLIRQEHTAGHASPLHGVGKWNEVFLNNMYNVLCYVPKTAKQTSMHPTARKAANRTHIPAKGHFAPRQE